MICPNCSTVNAENARFCISCGHPLPRICPVCGAINPPDARFCNQCGSPLTGIGVPPTAHGGVALQNGSRETVPTPPHPETAAEETTEQRRIVTILFADLTSSTALAEDMDPEDARALLAGFFGIMAREIHRHGGTVEKYIGDAVMAVFGLPVAHEDDPVRAVRAALDMQAALRQFNEDRRSIDPGAPELHMRIGINTGEVAAAGSATEGRDFLVTGDAVNVAARLQQLASPGAILVGSRTWRATQGAVQYRDLPAATVRNRARPVKIWEALAMTDKSAVPTARPRGVEGLKAPMVGRDVEMELMRAVSTRVMRERSPHLVTIIGSPGIGKTRLAREFMAHSGQAGARPRATRASSSGRRNTQRATAIATVVPTQPVMLEGRCPPYGEGITYWPLADMLRAYCGVQPLEPVESARARLLQCVTSALKSANRTDDPELISAYLGYTIGVESAQRRQTLLPTDTQQQQEGLLRAWRAFFEAIAQPNGLILLIEDIHWADDALLDLIEYVAARATDVPLLLLCTARPNLLDKRPEWGGGKRNYVTVGLEALTPVATQRLMRELLPGAKVPQSLRQGVLAKAEGNPFYIEEIIRMFVDLGILTRSRGSGTGWHLAPEWEGRDEVTNPGIPDTVQGVLIARLDLLSLEERDVLQHASVIGRYFWPSALIALAPHLELARLETLLSSLVQKELLLPTDHSKSSVAPLNEQVYSFNHALTREVVYGTIARTRRAHEHERVAAWLEDLARGREEEFAELLAQHYRQYYVQASLSRTRNIARRQAVLAKVVHYLTLAGDQATARHASNKADEYYTDTIRLLEEEAQPDDTPIRQSLYTKRGDARWLALRADEAWADYRTALELWSGYELASPSPQDETQPQATDSEATHFDWLMQGMRLYRLLVALPTRYTGYFQHVPTYEELKGYLDRGLKLADAAGCNNTAEYAALLTATSFFWMFSAEQRGERELLEALRSAREAVRITQALGDPRGASEALDALGNMLAITTDLRGFLESMTRRLQWAEQIDDPNELVDIHMEVSQAHQVVGEYSEAVAHGQTALQIATKAETEALQAHALRALVLAYFEWDHWKEAITAGEELRAISAHINVRLSHRQLAAMLALATTKARMGDRDGADVLSRRISETTLGTDVQYLVLGRARLALAKGATREARQLLLDGLEAREGRVGMALLLAELAELLAREGDVALYERYGAQALELGWRSGARKALAQAIRARGIVAMAAGRLEDGLADLESAFSRYADLGTAWEEARTRYALAGLFRRRAEADDEQRAREELSRALEMFTQLGAVRDIARARAALAGGDVRLP